MADDFLDFSAAERKLFWDVLKQPFDKWQTVLRWILSDLSFSYIQDMRPADVETLADLRDDIVARMLINAPKAIPEGEVEPQGYNYKATVEGICEDIVAEAQVEGEAEVELDASYQLLVDNLRLPSQANAVLWIWETANVEHYDNALDLRRKVCNQLQAEIAAAGDCSTWLIFFAWVVAKRTQPNNTWKQWSASQEGQTALQDGMNLFLAWRTMRNKKDREIVGDDNRDDAAPLG